MNVDRQQLEQFRAEVIEPVKAVAPEYGVDPKAVVTEAAVASEWGKFGVHNNAWRMEGVGDLGSNLEVVLAPCPKRVYKPVTRQVARFSSPMAAAREACKRFAAGKPLRPAGVGMIANKQGSSLRFAAWGGLADKFNQVVEVLGKASSGLVDSLVKSGKLTQSQAENLKAGGTVVKELGKGVVEIYQYDKKGDLVKKVVSGADADKALGKTPTKDKEVLFGLTQQQLLLGASGLVIAALLFKRLGR